MVNRTVRLAYQRITTGQGQQVEPHSAKKVFQARGRTSSGSGSAIVKIQGSNFGGTDSDDWVLIGTITLTLSSSGDTDGFATDAPWSYVRYDVDTLTGTDASVDIFMSVEDRSRLGHAEHGD